MPWGIVYAVATSPEASPPPARRPARDLIELVLEHMRRNLEPLKYSTLAPSRYVVYLHAAEYARLEGILGIIQQQTIRALNEELGTLNDAIADAKSRAGLDGNAETELLILPQPQGVLESLIGPLEDRDVRAPGFAAEALPAEARAALMRASRLTRLMSEEPILLMMPFDVRFR